MKDTHGEKWVKNRHKRVFAFLRILFKPFTKLRYNYTFEKSDIKGPCLILCNHSTTLDPFFLSLSFRFPVYFFTSDDLFNIKFISPIIKYLVAPIPKSKSQADLNAVRTCLKIFKEGGSVGIFPEGNRTLTGAQWEMTDAVARLVKLSKVPLVLYNINGGYGTDPRWGLKIRKGKMNGFVKRIIAPEEYAGMSVEELFAEIKNELKVYDPDGGIEFKSRRRAEKIERVLYRCPECGAVSSIKSKGAKFSCTSCKSGWQYTKDLHISPSERFDSILKWHDWEKSVTDLQVKTYGLYFEDKNIKFYESQRFKRKLKLDGNTVCADANGITVKGKKSSMRFNLNELDGFTILGKRKFNIYYLGKTYQVKGGKTFCPLKYLHLTESKNYV